MQNSAISFSICVDEAGEKIERLKSELSIHYQLKSNEPVDLITINNYDEQTLAQTKLNREVLLEQKTRATAQMVLK
jgi:aspartate kinase